MGHLNCENNLVIFNQFDYCKSGNFRAFRGKMVRRENKTVQILCRNVCLRVQACCPRN